jgi:hypothetical protein
MALMARTTRTETKARSSAGKGIGPFERRQKAVSGGREAVSKRRALDRTETDVKRKRSGRYDGELQHAPDTAAEVSGSVARIDSDATQPCGLRALGTAWLARCGRQESHNRGARAVVGQRRAARIGHAGQTQRTGRVDQRRRRKFDWRGGSPRDRGGSGGWRPRPGAAWLQAGCGSVRASSSSSILRKRHSAARQATAPPGRSRDEAGNGGMPVARGRTSSG